MTCSKCGRYKPPSQFYTRGKQCRDCRREYYHEYIYPALRGRGKARVLPEWAQNWVKRKRSNAKIVPIIRLAK